jgi:hypothetical protein
MVRETDEECSIRATGDKEEDREEELEARGGIEPPIMVLQTIALPLGDRAFGEKLSVLSHQLSVRKKKHAPCCVACQNGAKRAAPLQTYAACRSSRV